MGAVAQNMRCSPHHINYYGGPKNFDEWHRLKRQLHNNQPRVIPREGEVWFCSVGVNIGFEIDGKHKFYERPVLILKCCGEDSFLGVPMTSKLRESDYCMIVLVRDVPRGIVVTQLRLLDRRRLLRRIGEITTEDLNAVRWRLCVLLFKKTEPPAAVGGSSAAFGM